MILLVIISIKFKAMFNCQQNLLSPTFQEKAVLTFICQQSNSLYNVALYEVRQRFFQSSHWMTDNEGKQWRRGGKLVSYAFLCKKFKKNKNYRNLYSQAAQQTLKSLSEAIESYRQLLTQFIQGELGFHPSLPNYRKSGGFYGVTYPKKALEIKGNKIRLPLGRQVKAWFRLDSLYVPIPSNLDFGKIRELRILPRNQAFYVEYVYQSEVQVAKVDPAQVLAIDPGISNLLSCLDTVGNSFIVDGKHLKSLNQWYNKKVSSLKENRPQGFWSKRLANVTEKRNRQMRDGINKAAKIVINHCLKYGIGTIVFGWNEGIKQNCKLNKSTQDFVQIPLAKLKTRIAQLCEQYGLIFCEVNESYTSKSSYLDNDPLPYYKSGEKPNEEVKFSGRRIKRGLYLSKSGCLVNSDSQAAANLLRRFRLDYAANYSEVSTISLEKVSKGALIRPMKIKLFMPAKRKFSA